MAERPLHVLLGALGSHGRVFADGDGWRAVCPACGGIPTLFISAGEHPTLWCLNGCDPQDILVIVGLGDWLDEANDDGREAR